MRTPVPAAWRRLSEQQKRSSRADRDMRARVRHHHATRARPVDPVESAEIAGLRYVSDTAVSGIRRIGRKARFRYVSPHGRTIADRTELQRIRSLAIPPAWTDVWICPSARGHLQATGRDARGRKQYRYHARWREVRDEVKYGRLMAFAQTLPRIRQRTSTDVKKAGLTRDKVLAAVVQLLEKTLIRVGNEEYARQNQSIGLTTMRDKHAKNNGAAVRFEFRGKSGIEHAVDLHDRRLVRIVKACRDLPGHDLFQCIDEHGRHQPIGSTDVNAYLREITGQDFTAKDFRTWAGTVLAAKALNELERAKSKTQASRGIARAVESVAKSLGNTKAVCRRSYIHPAVLDAYMDGVTINTVRTRVARLMRASGLNDAEAAVASMISSRLRIRSAA